MEISGTIYLLGDVIELSKKQIKFRNSQNMFINNTFNGINNAVVIKEKSFGKSITGNCGILVEV